MTAFDVNRLLRLFAWARLGIAELLLIMAPFLPGDVAPGTGTGILALALFVVVVTSGALLLLPRLHHRCLVRSPQFPVRSRSKQLGISRRRR